jgi:hypothetical protein
MSFGELTEDELTTLLTYFPDLHRDEEIQNLLSDEVRTRIESNISELSKKPPRYKFSSCAKNYFCLQKYNNLPDLSYSDWEYELDRRISVLNFLETPNFKHYAAYEIYLLLVVAMKWMQGRVLILLKGFLNKCFRDYA